MPPRLALGVLFIQSLRLPPGIFTGRNPHWTESPMDGIPTGRNSHQNLMYQWAFGTVGIPVTEARNPHQTFVHAD